MLAVVKDPSKSGISLENVPMPEFSPWEVLIKVKAVGICGSDLRIYGLRDTKRTQKYILGHELSGEVEDLGERVDGFERGDRVATEICIGCAICRYCKKGLVNLCTNLNEVGITIDGGMAEYVSIPARNVHRIPEDVSFLEATFIDPLACSIRGLERVRIDPRTWVAVLGPGSIGLLAAQVARRILRTKVIVVGTNEYRLELAKRFGADYTFNIHASDPTEEILQITGSGVDYAFEAAGNPKALQQAIDITRKDGAVITMTVHKEIQINMEALIRNELSLHGSICYNYKEFDQAIDLIAKKKVELKALVARTFPLKEGRKAFNYAQSKQGVKTILEP